jgi:hypothetical protein
MSEAFTRFIPGYRGSYSLYSHCEVDELSAEGVLVAGDDAHVGLAEGPADNL